MNIPDKAVEAAAQAMYGPDWEHTHQGAIDATRRAARKALEAAAPFIREEALRHAADLFAEEEGIEVLAFAGEFTEVQAVRAVDTWLRERAALELDRQ